MSRVSYSVNKPEQVVCVPPQGFPRDRLVRYLELLRRQQAAPMSDCLAGKVQGFKPEEVRDFVQLMLDEDIILGLEPADQDYLVKTARPGINSYLQREARKIREARKQD